MPSWVRQIDGIDWFDERYVQDRTRQSPAQLARKVETGKLLRVTDQHGGNWYPGTAVDQLEAAYKRRVSAAKTRQPSEQRLEARYAKQAKELRQSARHGHISMVHHAERIMIAEIFAKEAERKKSGSNEGNS